MEAAQQLLPLVIPMLSGLLGGVITWLTVRRKNEAEAGKLNAEAGRIGVETLDGVLKTLRYELEEQAAHCDAEIADLRESYNRRIADLEQALQLERAARLADQERIKALEAELKTARGQIAALEAENTQLKRCVPPKGAL